MAVIAGVQSVAAPPSPPVFLQRDPSRFAVGCDLAQANDWTAVSVVEHKAGVLDYNTEFERHCGIGARPQVKAEYFDLRHLERVRGLSYVDIVDRLKTMMATPPLCGDAGTPPAELIVDATGVGRGVCDLISDAGLSYTGIVITGGTETTHAQGNFWHVSKLDLVSRLDGKLHSGALRIAAALKEVRLRARNLVARPAAGSTHRARRLLMGRSRLTIPRSSSLLQLRLNGSSCCRFCSDSSSMSEAVAKRCPLSFRLSM